MFNAQTFKKNEFKDENDIFFDNSDTDALFDNWSNLMGGEASSHAQETESSDPSPPKSADVKETCSLM
jgi:hypothetical protein